MRLKVCRKNHSLDNKTYCQKLYLTATVAAIGVLISSSSLYAGTKGGGKVIEMRSDLWCPYACEEGTKDPGLVVELAQIILGKQGYQVQYKTMNWSRAVKELEEGLFDAIAGAARTDVPTAVFPETPQAFARFEFFGLAGSKIKYHGDHKVFEKSGLGVIASYTYDEETNRLMRALPNWIMKATGDDGLAQLVKMLRAKRIGAFIENPGVFLDFQKKNHLAAKDFESLGAPKMPPQEIFIGFSSKKKESQKLADLMDAGMKKMKEDGTYQRLLHKYGLVTSGGS